MIGRMNDETVKRYSLAEITLLAIFVLGLVIAQIIVKIRHRVILSESIALTGSGLSVSMPINPKWEHETSWRYESDNSMVLVAQYQTGQPLKPSVQWRYDICSPGGSAQDILQQRVEQSGSKIDAVKMIPQPLPIYYATVYPAGDSDNSFCLGIISLDFGRHLELQVFVPQDFSYAEKLFLSLAKSIQYQPPPQLQAGKDLMNAFWNAVQSGSLSFENRPDEAFLIKNTQNHPVGYGYQHYSTFGANPKTHLQLFSRHYEHNVSLVESTFRFYGAQRRFTWKTAIQQAGAGRPRNYTLVQEPGGTVNISTNFENDKQFAADVLLLPELLLPECAALLLDSPQNNLTIDVLSATGFVVPTVIEKIEIQEASARSEQIAFVIKIDFLNHSESFEELYFDENRHFIGRFERQPLRNRIWDLTTPDTLEQLFRDNFQPINDSIAAAK